MKRPGGFIDWWGSKHLASNVILKETGQPLSNLHMTLRGKNSNVLVFGFLYNMEDASELVTVMHVKQVVNGKWFKDVLRLESYDAIMVMAHMGVVDPLVTVILNAIRSHVGLDMPVQFITGHTHRRGYQELDSMSTSVGNGRYLDTVGFLSFPTKQSAIAAAGLPNASALFQHVFLDANVYDLRKTLGVDYLETQSGRDLSDFIQETREAMGLNNRIGCAPLDYYFNTSLHDEDSLWGLYVNEVIPTQFMADDPSRAIFVSQTSWRYNLFGQRDVELDDIIAVSPFNEPIYFLGTFPGSVVLKLNETMNQEQSQELPLLPQYILAGSVYPESEEVKLYAHESGLAAIIAELKTLHDGNVGEPEVIDGITSTTIWISFVIDEWPCSGIKGILPSWFGNDSSGQSSSKNGGMSSMTKSILLVVFGLFVLVVGAILLCLCLRCIFCGERNEGNLEELDAININEGEFT
jgi:hypothetical protein